jgi:hypothetical protein
MSYLQEQKPLGSKPGQDVESAALADLGDTATFGANDPTVDCYNRRARILTDADKAEWWVAIAVLLLIIGVGFVAI